MVSARKAGDGDVYHARESPSMDEELWHELHDLLGRK